MRIRVLTLWLVIAVALLASCTGADLLNDPPAPHASGVVAR